ncbi:hypothetical protein [Alicyclobacillus sp. SO9]|uniref:hypothetical protein n=1 Tax=Alicyclobacillus sp. SO9 TaxID=2665646 RepID=UPI0018E8119A|nr:hypothetical protein [Alicyclobacillus sp. SO9]QQE78189.1 hypothetical protein GI364_20250 [Alicyclobacillus sp. SO9]
MKNESNLEQSLTRLKPAAEMTVMKDIKMSRQLEDSIIEAIQLEDSSVHQPVRSRTHLWAFVAIAIATIMTFAALLMGHSPKNHREAITAIEVSISSVVPAAALTAVLAAGANPIQKNLTMSLYPIDHRRTQYSASS